MSFIRSLRRLVRVERVDASSRRDAYRARLRRRREARAIERATGVSESSRQGGRRGRRLSKGGFALGTGASGAVCGDDVRSPGESDSDSGGGFDGGGDGGGD